MALLDLEDPLGDQIAHVGKVAVVRRSDEEARNGDKGSIVSFLLCLRASLHRGSASLFSG